MKDETARVLRAIGSGIGSARSIMGSTGLNSRTVSGTLSGLQRAGKIRRGPDGWETAAQVKVAAPSIDRVDIRVLVGVNRAGRTVAIVVPEGKGVDAALPAAPAFEWTLITATVDAPRPIRTITAG